MKHKTTMRFPVLLILMSVSGAACAHSGHGYSGLLSGLLHPFSGLDHLCAMIAVGLWAAQMGGRAVWRVPLTFVSVMTIGGWLGMASVPVPLVETGIVMSLLVLGVLIAAAVQLPLLASSSLVGVFAIFHGYTHGTEMPQSLSGFEYAVGFILATALLHAIGIAMALWIGKMGRKQWLRGAGVAIALCGGMLWFVG